MVNGMRKYGNRGFTLIELIATLVVLVLVMSLGTYSITGLVQKSRYEKNSSSDLNFPSSPIKFSSIHKSLSLVSLMIILSIPALSKTCAKSL